MQPVRVLLIEDDEDDYILTKEIFNDIPQKDNYKLSWINNYEEAINAMLKNHYDIYLVDYRLGKYTGIDLLHEAIKSNVDEPIIILTGKGDSKVDQTALEIGAADYLVKDQITPFAIERSIRYALKHTQTLKALKESENKFRIIFERSNDPFIITDSAGKIRDINRAGLSFFNYTKDELFMLNSAALYADKDDKETFIQKMEQKGAVNDFDTVLITKNGEHRPAYISAFLQIDQHATEELYYCIIRDLSSKKQIEQNSVDKEKNGHIEQFVNKLSTEIRNPLSAINLSLNQLKLDLNTQDEQINLYLNILDSNFRKINTIVSNLSVTEKDQDLNIQTRSLHQILENCLEKVNYYANLNQVEIFRDFSADDSIINVDEKLISESIQSILNSILVSDCNNITITSATINNLASIEIKDDSQGLSPEQQITVFDPNNKANLAKAKKIITDHKGMLKIESIPFEGNTFTISLPVSSQTKIW